ncbi:hypothetical protein GQ457_06G012060 [Hibiscus cannabinus]
MGIEVNPLCRLCGPDIETRSRHRCAKTQLYQIVVEDTDEDIEQEVFLDCEENVEEGLAENSKEEGPLLSLNALWGDTNWETMKLKVTVAKDSYIALLDSRSTHNFISTAMVKNLRLVVNKKNEFKVTVADESGLNTVGLCNLVAWEAQGKQFVADFLEGKEVMLRGMQSEKLKWIDTHACEKMLRGNNTPCTAALWLLSPQLEMKNKNEPLVDEIQELLQQFKMVFEEPKGLPPERGHNHKIELVDEKAIVKIKPYRHPTNQKDEIERLVGEMLEAGIIRDSDSSFSSPIVMVKKQDGSWCMCIDYRRLNQLTIEDNFQMPMIEELLDELGVAIFFSKLDLRSGYHQIRMKETDIPGTAFRTHEGHYEFLVIPFGLTNAPTTFQGLMNKVFKKQLRKYVLVFFDDILVHSSDWNSHLLHLKEVFVGAVCSGIWCITRPLAELLKKGGWKWGKEEETTFEALKQAVSSAPVLALPDFNLEFIVETDASDQGVGIVPVQKGKPLAFFSKGLGVRYQGLSVYEKEMLAALMAVKKWPAYLVGRHFIIKTDHQSLKFLAENQAINTFQQKWVVKKMGYDYEVQYRKGVHNVVADVLSRRPEIGSLLAMGMSKVTTDMMDRVAATWRNDEKLLKVVKNIEKWSNKHMKYKWDGNILKRKENIVVGNDVMLRRELIKFFHGSAIGGHSGEHATTQRLTTVFYWKGLRREVKNFVRELSASTAYHPQSDGQTERVNQRIETYLRCMTGEKPKEWADWLHLAEWWYNTIFHTAIQLTPYQAMYGQPPPIHLPYIAGDSVVAAVDRSLQQREVAIKMLKFHIKRAHDRMKPQADKEQNDCEFQVGEWVFLKLQPYRQQSVVFRNCQKLVPKWFGPFMIIAKVGKVAHKLKFPDNSKVHPMFHVSQLKKQVGSNVVQSDLPVIGPDDSMSNEPVKIIDRRIGKRGNREVTEVLVEWSNTFPEDATWKVLHLLQQQFSHFDS